MNKSQVAKRIGKDPKTLGNWEKTNKELYNLLKKGLEAEEQEKKPRNENINFDEEIKKMIQYATEKEKEKIYHLIKAII
jgi:hypothetical protein